MKHTQIDNVHVRILPTLIVTAFCQECQEEVTGPLCVRYVSVATVKGIQFFIANRKGAHTLGAVQLEVIPDGGPLELDCPANHYIV